MQVNASGHRGIAWDEQPLGQMPDVRMAVVLGVTSAAVRKARIKRGIPTYHRGRWCGSGIGERSDKELAGAFGVSRRTVSRARKQLGLPGPKVIDWDSQPLLGVISDTALGRNLGVHQSVVSSARRRRDIPRADRLCLTKEGEGATYPEALIDLYWHHNSVGHQFQVKVGPYIVDWLLADGLLVEYAGFDDRRIAGRPYEERLRHKLAYYKSNGHEVLVIRPSGLDAYDLGCIPVFHPRRRVCRSCGAVFGVDKGPLGGVLRHKAHGLCKNCYRKLQGR